MRRVRSGDGEAFGPLAGYYAARIYGHAYRIVRNSEDAEDVTQETFLRAFNKLSEFEMGRSFRNWLYAIATNLALNTLRSRTRRERLRTRAAAEPHPDPTDTTASLDQDQRKAEVARAVDTLPPRDAALIHLHYRESMTLSDAAESLGMTEGAARTAIHRARSRLRTLLIDREK